MNQPLLQRNFPSSGLISVECLDPEDQTLGAIFLCESPAFAYTIGLSLTTVQPELCILGLTWDIATLLLRLIARRFSQDPWPIRPGELLDGLPEKPFDRLAVVQITDLESDLLRNQPCAPRGGLQIIWPNENGEFKPSAEQPFLGHFVWMQESKHAHILTWDSPPFALTFGLDEYEVHPELCVFGLSQREAVVLLDSLIGRFRDEREWYRAGRCVTDPTFGRLAVLEVTNFEDHHLQSHPSEPEGVLQIVWPDEKGEFRPSEQQPFLGRLVMPFT